ncbi:MAG TPA: LPS assembly protein LptD [Candidatus Sulfopaludibacter sp.]|jgi:LPS-assembly protein|nr:LPS assembly protein LptD [Candidatus Sulfopaludibacter sp.]
MIPEACHEKSSSNTYIFAPTLLGWLILASVAFAQPQTATQAPQEDAAKTITPAWPAIKDSKTFVPGEWILTARDEESDGPLRKLHGHAQVQSASMLIRADEIEYNEDTKDVVAKGNVYFHSYEKGEQLWCDHMEYNTEEQRGKFFEVRGESMPRLVARKGILSGTSPYHFEGEWAERLGEQYILYNGWVTNCKMPNPWWKMRGPKFDIIPQERAKAYKSWFILRRIPLFYAPYFYHSLVKEPRHSGFLIPNLVPRSQRGFMIGLGYFWAINRSYDVTYRFQDYNSNAFGHHVDFRGKPRPGTDFDFILYGVQDRGGDPNNSNQQFSGMNLYFVGRSDLGKGWHANGFVNYVSSFRFRQEWSESFNEAIGSEIHSEGYVEKNWSNYSVDLVASRLENFQSGEVQQPGQKDFTRNAVLIYKLPEAQLNGREKQLFSNLPIWFSFESSAGLMSRSQPIFDTSYNLIDNFQTAQVMSRVHFAPHFTSALHLGAISLVPSVGIDETFYGQSQMPSAPGSTLYQVVGENVVRSARDFSLDLILPSLARVYNKKTIFGDKLKHVIEPRATYRYVTGVGDDFNRYIRFDSTDLLANTSEVEISLTNRIFAKRGDSVLEIFTWQLAQKRYFDPTFGGAVVGSRPDVFAATADLTAYAFVLGPRSYSPVVSTLRASPIAGLGFTWQADYDPYYRRVVDSSFSVDYHFLKKYFVSAGNNEVRTDPLLTPAANQYRMRLGFGDPQHRGWNAGIDAVYDYRKSVLEYSTTQVTYNTDCCGFSVQYRRYNVGVRDESRLTVAFAIANVGTFGTLKKQDRLF